MGCYGMFCTALTGNAVLRLVRLLQSSLFHYIKANHSFIRLYRTNTNVIDLPRTIYVLVASVFFQLLLCIEFSRGGSAICGHGAMDVVGSQPRAAAVSHAPCPTAGLALGATWILSIITWQPCLILITWSVTVVRVRCC